MFSGFGIITNKKCQRIFGAATLSSAASGEVLEKNVEVHETRPGWLPALQPPVSSGLAGTLWMAPLRMSGSAALPCLLELNVKSNMGPSEDLWAESHRLMGSIPPGSTASGRAWARPCEKACESLLQGTDQAERCSLKPQEQGLWPADQEGEPGISTAKQGEGSPQSFTVRASCSWEWVDIPPHCWAKSLCT